MKTAISLPDDDFLRIDRVAGRHGMNRSEFYRIAALRYADVLEGSSHLTVAAEAAFAAADESHDTDDFLRAAQSTVESSEW